MLRGFRQFILRGNVVDFAVAVVIGAAFGGVVTAFVRDLLTPLIAAIFGKPDFAGLSADVNGSRFIYGDFINSLVAFVLVPAAVYFFVVAPINAYMAHKRRGEAPSDPTTQQCPECMSEIPAGVRRGAFCTATILSRAAQKRAA